MVRLALRKILAIAGPLELAPGLEVEPELGRCTESALESKGKVGPQRGAGEDGIDRRGIDSQFGGKVGGA